MVRPRPPMRAATLAPTGNSPPGDDFTTPTHSMPLTGAAAAHMHLGVVDAEGLDMDDHMAILGLRLRNILVDKAVRTAEFLDNDGAHDDLSMSLGGVQAPHRGADARLRGQLGRKSRMVAAISA